MRGLLVVVAVIGVLVETAWGAPPKEEIGDALWQRAAQRTREAALELDGVMAVGVRDLTSGRSFLLRGQQVMPAASIIKIAVLIELQRQAGAKLIDPGQGVVLRREQQIGDEGLISLLGDGTSTMSLGDLAAAMILLSENSATNVLIERLGMERINQTLRLSGLRSTVLRRRMLDVEAARQGKENTTTVEDMLRLLQLLWSEDGAGLGLSREGQKESLRLLRAADKPGAVLPGAAPGVKVASKPGVLEGMRGECGVVELPRRPYAICVLTTLLRVDAEGEAAIARVARLWFEALSRMARATPEGRLL